MRRSSDAGYGPRFAKGPRIIKMFTTGGHGTVGPAERTEMTRDEMSAAVEAAHDRGVKMRPTSPTEKPSPWRSTAAWTSSTTVTAWTTSASRASWSRRRRWSRRCSSRTGCGARFGGGLGFTDSLKADIDAGFAWLPRANEAGVRLVVGDDYGAIGFPHGIYGEELAFYVDVVGIPALDVLRWATVNGAELMGRGHELGTVRPASWPTSSWWTATRRSTSACRDPAAWWRS